MDIILENIGKRFSNREWIFEGIHEHFESGERIALTGNNGSGKSTLIKTIAGVITPNRGVIKYLDSEAKDISADRLIHHICFAAPYIELIEEFTLLEMIAFHFKFKKIDRITNFTELIACLYLQGHEHKTIKHFSSGMKQRLKLGLVFYSKCDILLLDEPTTNMDEKGIRWYQEQINNISDSSIVIIASNQKYEYDFVKRAIDMNYRT